MMGRLAASALPVAAFKAVGRAVPFDRSGGRSRGVCGGVGWGIILMRLASEISENKAVLRLEKCGLLRYDFSENAGLLH